MKKYILLFSILLSGLTARANVAYSFEYAEGYRADTPAIGLIIHDFAYNLNTKYILSCMNRLATLKYGTLLNLQTCMAPLINETGTLVGSEKALANDFKTTANGSKILRISLENTPWMFIRLISCLAGRSKYIEPSRELEVVKDCEKDIKDHPLTAEQLRLLNLQPKEIQYALTLAEQNQSSTVALFSKFIANSAGVIEKSYDVSTKGTLELLLWLKNSTAAGYEKFQNRKHRPLDELAENVVNLPSDLKKWYTRRENMKLYSFTDLKFTEPVRVYVRCLKFAANKKSYWYKSDVEAFKDCYQNLKDYVDAPNKSKAFSYTDIILIPQNYSKRVMHAIELIKLRSTSYEPLALALQCEVESFEYYGE